MHSRTHDVGRSIILSLGLGLLLVGCQGGTSGDGTGVARDESPRARAMLQSYPLDQAQLEAVLPGGQQAWLEPMLAAYAHWPGTLEVQTRLYHAYENPERDQELDIPELFILLGALREAGYPDPPVETYVPIMLKRVFAIPEPLFPDLTREDPPGIPLNQLLTSAHAAAASELAPPLRERLDLTFGANPAAFSHRNPRWALKLVTGGWGELKITPEDMFHQATLAATVLDYDRLLPAFRKVAKDTTAINEFRFSSAVATCLLTEDPAQANAAFTELIFKDTYLPTHYSREAYRVLASRQDPELYPVIQQALAELPAAQHLDYAEFLARYGKVEDLPVLFELIDAPVDAVDARLTTARSGRLLNPLTRDVAEATQMPEALAMREAMAGQFAKQESGATPSAPAPGKPLLPTTILTDPAQAASLAKELLVPPSTLYSEARTPDQVRAARLWWLRFYPVEAIMESLAIKLRKGSEAEQIVALRILGLQKDPAALPTIALGFNSKHRRVKLEAGIWYLTLQEQAQRAAGEMDPADQDAEPAIAT